METKIMDWSWKLVFFKIIEKLFLDFVRIKTL